VVGTLAFNFQTILPLLAHFTFGKDASGYAALLAAMGAGAIAGALANGARGSTGPRLIVLSSVAFGIFGLVAAAAPTFPLEIAAMVPLGAASITFAAGVNSQLQLGVEPEMRGRVMALYGIVFLGSTPIGGPLTGWLAETLGPRSGLVLGGVAALTAAAGARIAFARPREGAGSALAPGYRHLRAHVRAQFRLHGHGRPAERDRQSERGDSGGGALHHASRRDGHRQDVHDGGSDGRARPSLARHRA
jgi:MFS family permease